MIVGYAPDALVFGAGTAPEYSEFTNVAGFAPGTLISTTDGDLPVEWLNAGDKIITRDHGALPLRAMGRQRISRAALAASPHLWPVRLSPALFGGYAGARPLFVSSRHRVLLQGVSIEYHFDRKEVLAQAGHLAPPSLAHVPPVAFTYHHLLFDRHEVILANGIWCESLFLGDQPENLQLRSTITHQRTARMCLKRWEAALWLETRSPAVVRQKTSA